MRKWRHAVLSCTFLAVVGSPALVAPAAIIEDNFNNLSNDATFPPSGSAWTGGSLGAGVTRTSSTDHESSISNVSNGLGIVQTDTSTSTGQGVGFSQVFSTSVTTGSVRISFDYRINNSDNNDLTPTLLVDTTADTAGDDGFFFNLAYNTGDDTTGGNDTLKPGYQTSGSVTTLNYTLTKGTWYHVQIDTTAVEGATDKFTVTITPAGGTATTFSDLSFRKGVSSLDRISFYNNNVHSTTGSFSIDNVVVVPEPGTAAAAGVGGLLLALRRRPVGR